MVEFGHIRSTLRVRIRLEAMSERILSPNLEVQRQFGVGRGLVTELICGDSHISDFKVSTQESRNARRTGSNSYAQKRVPSQAQSSKSGIYYQLDSVQAGNALLGT